MNACGGELSIICFRVPFNTLVKALHKHPSIRKGSHCSKTPFCMLVLLYVTCIHTVHYLKVWKYDKNNWSPFLFSLKRNTYMPFCLFTTLMPERKKDILTSFKRPKWPIRPNKRLNLEVLSRLWETNQNKINITP